jgi:hypothetical protein
MTVAFRLQSTLACDGSPEETAAKTPNADTVKTPARKPFDARIAHLLEGMKHRNSLQRKAS